MCRDMGKLPCMGRDETYVVCWLCILIMILVRDTLSVGSPTISIWHTLNMWSLVGWPFLMSCFQETSKPAKLTHLLAIVYVFAKVIGTWHAV